MPDLAELRRQIGELALQAVMADPDDGSGGATPPPWKPALERLYELAERERAGAIAAATAALMGIVGRNTSADEMQTGIIRLQEALDLEAAGRQPAPFAPAQDRELVSDFVLESREHLATIEAQVLTLERDPHDSEALNAVFRGFHTIKGLAGFLELWEVQRLAHEVETVLDCARNATLAITPAAVDVILESSDELRVWMAHVESGLNDSASAAPPLNEPLLARVRALAAEPAAAAATADLAQMAASVEAPDAVESPEAVDAVEAVEAPSIPAPEAAAAVRTEGSGGRRAAEAMAVRVDTAKLDSLVDMAGEMVIAQSLVRHDPELGSIKTPRFQRNMAQLARITAELQKTAMAMRLVPVGPVFRRMERLVRDLARQFGKQVEMETQGEEIELDRTIVEELADPLMHMIRNALDHGIESPSERERAGKNPVARLLLKGRHHAGQVVIEITDDGKGLDRERIAAKAVQKGLMASADSLSDAEVYNLIFHPGFSTAAQVTNVSGRGVGMDVVRRHVEKLRGRIEIRSTMGRGATFLIKVPLTLAIIDGLVVGVGRERYIAPLFSVREVLRPTAEMLWTVQQRSEMALIRGELVPVVRLYRKFQVPPLSEDPLRSVLLVAEVEGRKFCVLVDELIGKQEVVIKTLGETFKDVPGIAGGAILGDGRVGLILDMDRLFREGLDDARH